MQMLNTKIRKKTIKMLYDYHVLTNMYKFEQDFYFWILEEENRAFSNFNFPALLCKCAYNLKPIVMGGGADSAHTFLRWLYLNEKRLKVLNHCNFSEKMFCL